MSRYSDSDIECAIQTVASLIDRFGDAYWPILELLEDELARRQARAEKLCAYLHRDVAELPSGRMARPAIRPMSVSAPVSGRVKGKAAARSRTRPLTRPETDRASAISSNAFRTADE
jgi:hypothetical protein